MKRSLAILLCSICATPLWGATIFVEDFAAVSNPSNVVGSLPLNEWHMDSSTEWQQEGWNGEEALNSVDILDGSNLVSALQLGWKADNVEVRHILSNDWNFRKDYELTGEWEKIDDSGENHLGFHIYLSEYASTGFVQHVKHLHVDPGNPSVGATNRFTLSVSALELINVHANPSNHIGITFVRSEDADLEHEVREWIPKNDMYAVDNLALSETDSPDLAGVIMQPVYLSESGNNLNDGLSPSSPWKNVTALDTRTFGPGAQILFKRGETFNGACTLSGNGIASDPIVMATYGTGDKPLLTGWFDKKEVILLTDTEGIEIRDLRFSNYNVANSIADRHGINLEPPENAGDLRHYRFIDLDFFDIQGSSTVNHNCQGIWANTADNDDAAVPSRWNDMLIEGCTFSNIDGRGAQVRDKCLDITDVIIGGRTNYYPSLGFVFQNNYGTNCYRNMLQLRGTKDAVIQYNTMDTTVHGSAFWPFGTDGTLVQFNIFKHLRNPDADCYVCHFDYNCIGTVMQYNYGYDVQGGLIQFLVNSEFPDTFQLDAVARYNIGVEVGWRNKDNSAGIHVSGRVDGAQIYNNTVITLSDRASYKAISFNDWGGEWPRNCTLYNNLFNAIGSPSTYNAQVRMTNYNNVVSHNLYYGNISPPYSDLHPFTGDPMFTHPGGLDAVDYKVGYGSAAITNGLGIIDNGGRDWFGYAVSSNTLPTLGFHEYTADPVIDSDDDGMFDQWESGYGLDPADPLDATEDPDTDLLENLYEFGMGGDPTNGNDIGHVPTFGMIDVSDGTNRFTYVYPRRTDWQEIGLDYDLGVTDDLVAGAWVDWAHWIDGVGAEAFGEGFDAVTNYLSLDNEFKQRFIRLEIEKP